MAAINTVSSPSRASLEWEDLIQTSPIAVRTANDEVMDHDSRKGPPD
jgi:hypothetical protein